MAFTYSGDPSNSDLDWLRFQLADTKESSALLSDEEVQFLFDTAADRDAALFAAIDALLVRLARLADSRSIGPTTVTYTDKISMLRELRRTLTSSRPATLWAGGVNVEDRQDRADDTLVQPRFYRGQFRHRSVKHDRVD